MIRQFLLTLFGFIVLCTTGFASQESPLKERLKGAKSGDYVVTETNQMISVLVVRSLTEKTLTLEEITAPSNTLNPRPHSWGEWIKKRAPGHTSWIMMEIDLPSNQPLECYSFSRTAWLQLSSHESLIATLLGLDLEIVPSEERRKIGPPPLSGESDHRSLWKPPVIVGGLKLDHIDFDVYKTSWPKDGTELSGNDIFLYFDRSLLSPFPVWIQITTSHLTAALRVIDSGKNLPAAHKSLPKRIPEFVGPAQKTSKGLKLALKSPKYYQSFELFVIDVTSQEKQVFPITHSLISGEGELLQIEIQQDELDLVLKANHRYTWLLVPTGQSKFYTESHKAFLWKG